LDDDVESLPQPINTSPGAPQPGEPYNYSKVLDTVLIPQVVYADKTLAPGARILWGIVRRLGHKTGQCFASDGRLAEEMAVSERQVRRYCRQLVKAGLMRETPEPGRVTVRELLWHTRFHSSAPAANGHASSQANGKRRLDDGNRPRARSDVSGGCGHKCPGGVDTNVQPHPYSGVLKASLEADSPPPSDTPPLDRRPAGAKARAGDRGGGGGARSAGLTPASAGKPGPSASPYPFMRTNEVLGHQEPDATSRTVEQLAKFLRFQYLTLMHEEPPLDVLNAICKILRARRADHIAYACTMTETLKVLKAKPTAGIWVKKALEVGTEVRATQIKNPD
jgi:hypothetical protein